jgi:phospholipid transport system substrate-binding protein
MVTRRLLVPVLVLVLGLLGARSAWAASPTETLQALFSIANMILQAADPARGPDEPRQSIRSLVDQVADYPEVAELALGPVWKTRTPDEQAEFVALFADSLERDFVALAGSRMSVDGGLRVEYLAESVVGNTATVSSVVLTRSGTELSIDYSMTRRQGRWMVRDVVIEGVSLLTLSQGQFAQFLGTSSFPALLQKMRDNAPAAPRPAQSVAAPAAPRLAKPPARVSPPALASSPAATRYWVQVGAFKSEERAVRVAEELRSLGMPASSGSLTSVPGHAAGALARVRVGPFPTRAAALSKLRELAALGYAPFISKSIE